MNKKIIIPIILILLIIAGGVFWWWQVKEETREKATSGEKTLEERIKEENPEVAKRLEEEKREEKNENWATSLTELNSFKVPEKCFKGEGLISRSVDGIWKTDDGTVCTKVIKLQGTANKITDTFVLESEEAVGFNFYVMLRKLPSAKKNPAYIISAYKVGEEKSVRTNSNVVTRKQLQEQDWSPEKFAPPAGVVRGSSAWVEGPGEFYFKIEVENVDSWLLELRKGLITEFTG